MVKQHDINSVCSLAYIYIYLYLSLRTIPGKFLLVVPITGELVGPLVEQSPIPYIETLGVVLFIWRNQNTQKNDLV